MLFEVFVGKTVLPFAWIVSSELLDDWSVALRHPARREADRSKPQAGDGHVSILQGVLAAFFDVVREVLNPEVASRWCEPLIVTTL